MKKKTVIIILSVVGGLALLAGLGTHFIISLKADREAMRKQIVEVKDVYKVFSGHIDTFNEIRNNLYSSVLDNVYYLCDEGIKKGKRFTGAMVGMYAFAGDAIARNQGFYAEFDYFNYSFK